MKKLANLKPGAYFFYGGVQWVVLENNDKIGATLSIAAEPVFNRAFDEENRNDWRVSSLRRELNGPFFDVLNIGDTDPDERVLKDDDFSITYGGTEVLPLRTRTGIIFIQKKYLAPLEDVLDVVQLYERVTPDGQTYVAAKAGLLIAAVIFPYKVVNEKFVTRLEEITRECRRVLDAPPPVRPLERDDTQGNLFEA